MPSSNSKMLRPMGMQGHNSDFPAVNRPVERRYRQMAQRSHDGFVSAAKPGVDTWHKTTYDHIFQDGKGAQTRAERELQIAHENHMIQDKLERIKDKERPPTARLRYTCRTGIRLTPSGMHKLDNHKERFLTSQPQNAPFRRSQQEAIAGQNHRIYEKVRGQRPAYSLNGFKQAAEVHARYLDMLRKAPEVKPSRPPVRPQWVSDTGGVSELPKLKPLTHRNTYSGQSLGGSPGDFDAAVHRNVRSHDAQAKQPPSRLPSRAESWQASPPHSRLHPRSSI